MKRIFFVFLLSFLASVAEAQPIISYTVTDRPDLVGVEDINAKGDWIRNRFDPVRQTLIAEVATRKNKNVPTVIQPIECGGDTMALALTNKTRVVGSCTTTNVGDRIDYGLSWTPNKGIELLRVPGADITTVYGGNDRGLDVGEYLTPGDFNRSGLFRIHGFIRRNGHYQTVDVELPNTYTVLHRATNRERILLEYLTFDPATNNMLEHNWCIVDNGQFECPFPAEHPGDPQLDVLDMNNDDMMLIVRTSGDDAWNGIFLWDDGKLFEVGLPFQINGARTVWELKALTDNGEIEGNYTTILNCDPTLPFGGPDCVRRRSGFIATPN